MEGELVIWQRTCPCPVILIVRPAPSKDYLCEVLFDCNPGAEKQRNRMVRNCLRSWHVPGGRAVLRTRGTLPDSRDY